MYAVVIAGIIACVALAEWFDDRENQKAVVVCGIALLVLVGAAFCTYLYEDHEAAMRERPESVWTEIQEQMGETRD